MWARSLLPEHRRASHGSAAWLVLVERAWNDSAENQSTTGWATHVATTVSACAKRLPGGCSWVPSGGRLRAGSTRHMACGVCQVARGCWHVTRCVCHMAEGCWQVARGVCQVTGGFWKVARGVCQVAGGCWHVARGVCQVA